MGFSLNVGKIKKEKALRESKPKPKVKIITNTTRKPELAISETEIDSLEKKVSVISDAEIPNFVGNELKRALLVELNTEMTRLKKLRAIQSTRIAPLVDNVRKTLSEQHPEMERQFASGNLKIKEIEDLAYNIQSFSDQMAAIHDKIQYVEAYGQLPMEKKDVSLNVGEVPDDIAQLNHQIRRHDDMIYKTKRSLNSGKKKGIEKTAELELKLALAEAKREELKQKRERLRHEKGA